MVKKYHLTESALKSCSSWMYYVILTLVEVGFRSWNILKIGGFMFFDSVLTNLLQISL